jgi:hypothetical protein
MDLHVAHSNSLTTFRLSSCAGLPGSYLLNVKPLWVAALWKKHSGLLPLSATFWASQDHWQSKKVTSCKHYGCLAAVSDCTVQTATVCTMHVQYTSTALDVPRRVCTCSSRAPYTMCSATCIRHAHNRATPVCSQYTSSHSPKGTHITEVCPGALLCCS